MEVRFSEKIHFDLLASKSRMVVKRRGLDIDCKREEDGRPAPVVENAVTWMADEKKINNHQGRLLNERMRWAMERGNDID